MITRLASNNPYLVSDCKTVQMRGFSFLLLPRFIRARTLTSVQEHKVIAESADADDSAESEALSTEHIDRTIEMLEYLSGDQSQKVTSLT